MSCEPRGFTNLCPQGSERVEDTEGGNPRAPDNLPMFPTCCMTKVLGGPGTYVYTQLHQDKQSHGHNLAHRDTGCKLPPDYPSPTERMLLSFTRGNAAHSAGCHHHSNNSSRHNDSQYLSKLLLAAHVFNPLNSLMQKGGKYHYPHFTEEEIKVEGSCTAEWGLRSRQPALGVGAMKQAATTQRHRASG